MARFPCIVFLSALLVALTACSHSQAGPEATPDPPSRRLSPMEETGRRLYLSVCAYCHGVEGDGFGLNAPNLPFPPRNLTDAAYMSGLTDEQLFKAIELGGAGVGKSSFMPAWGGRFGDREIAALLAYVRTLAIPSAKSLQE